MGNHREVSGEMTHERAKSLFSNLKSDLALMMHESNKAAQEHQQNCSELMQQLRVGEDALRELMALHCKEKCLLQKFSHIQETQAPSTAVEVANAEAEHTFLNEVLQRKSNEMEAQQESLAKAVYAYNMFVAEARQRVGQIQDFAKMSHQSELDAHFARTGVIQLNQQNDALLTKNKLQRERLALICEDRSALLQHTVETQKLYQSLRVDMQGLQHQKNQSLALMSKCERDLAERISDGSLLNLIQETQHSTYNRLLRLQYLLDELNVATAELDELRRHAAETNCSLDVAIKYQHAMNDELEWQVSDSRALRKMIEQQQSEVCCIESSICEDTIIKETHKRDREELVKCVDMIKENIAEQEKNISAILTKLDLAKQKNDDCHLAVEENEKLIRIALDECNVMCNARKELLTIRNLTEGAIKEWAQFQMTYEDASSRLDGLVAATSSVDEKTAALSTKLAITEQQLAAAEQQHTRLTTEGVQLRSLWLDGEAKWRAKQSEHQSMLNAYADMEKEIQAIRHSESECLHPQEFEEEFVSIKKANQEELQALQKSVDELINKKVQCEFNRMRTELEITTKDAFRHKDKHTRDWAAKFTELAAKNRLEISLAT